ncbi:hypothetical protein MMC28_010315 [Mycoblastus sanguinarius]|nr:hypothetical protein [Mycoblastus sanguinarius]
MSYLQYLNAGAHGKTTPHQYRMLLLCLQFFGIILFSVVLGLYDHYLYDIYPNSYRYSDHDWTSAAVLGFLILAFIWTLYVAIRPSHTNKRLHPGWEVGLNLVFWIFLLCCTILASFFSTVLNYLTFSAQRAANCKDPDTNHRYITCLPEFKRLTGLKIFACSVAYTVAIIHFMLFVGACKTCKKYKQEKKNLTPVDSEISIAAYKLGSYRGT